MVGDVKQSIYRFRQAEPANFLNKYKRYDGTHGTRIDLNANFRSRSAILSAANGLFSRIMLGEVGEIDYSDNAALRSGMPIGGAEDKIPEAAHSDKAETAYGDKAEAAAYGDKAETAHGSEAERGSAELILIDLNDGAELWSDENDSDNGRTKEEENEQETNEEENFETYERAEAEAM